MSTYTSSEVCEIAQGIFRVKVVFLHQNWSQCVRLKGKKVHALIYVVFV